MASASGTTGMSTIFEDKIDILTMNVQGLRNAKKRKSLFRQFKQSKCDIVALQETYIMEEDRELIEREWGGVIHISEGTRRSKGMLTLFRRGMEEISIQSVHISDRILVSSLTANKETVLIFNIYAPCIETEKDQF